MITKVLKAIPEVFSLRGYDYSRHIKYKSSEQMMNATWDNMGKRMRASIQKVEESGKTNEKSEEQSPAFKETCFTE